MLGVGAVYLSPVLQSTLGSDHGYDTTDPTPGRHRPRRGGGPAGGCWTPPGDAGLGVVVDMVPNHLGISVPAENPAWWDVLRHGRASAYADWFDIDWSRGRIVVPVLGDDATLTVADGELRYFEHRFPLAPGSWTEGDDPDAVHARQHYELVHHSRGNAELNYRRFFAVTTLAGVRVGGPGRARGDPRPGAGAGWTPASPGCGSTTRTGWSTRPSIWTGCAPMAPDAWITVEKILEAGEELPTSWPVAGTTGYDAMREVERGVRRSRPRARA